jgi:uncharacterized protein YeaO (DUF488 family)
MNQIRIKRVYEPIAQEDGTRILVDRLWPRGRSKQTLGMQEWRKEISPSNDLRKAFHSGSITFEEFSDRYLAELNANPAAEDFVRDMKAYLKQGNVTLLYAARTVDHNHALILQHWLQERL